MIHVWFSIINNAINASNFYTDSKVINNDQLKINLIFGLLTIFMISYIYVAFNEDSERANVFFIESTFIYGYILFYLIATLTKYNLVEGLLKPIKISFKNIVPRGRKKE
jgi:hypothetical protein